jgi:hypothetical protein
MAEKFTDKTVLHVIQRLADEERMLYEKSNLSDQERERIRLINIELDQAWDFLRQRRATREFGEDPADAKIRSPRTVEKYAG